MALGLTIVPWHYVILHVKEAASVTMIQMVNWDLNIYLGSRNNTSYFPETGTFTVLGLGKQFQLDSS